MVRDEIVDTDVLVIGSGGAGTMAAIKADDEGADVTVVTKSKMPSGCTPIAMGAMQAACDLRDSPDIHFKDTFESGAHLNRKRLIRTMVAEALARIHDLEGFGTEFCKEDEDYKLFPIQGCTYPRAIAATEPYEGGFVRGLVKEVRKREIQVLENVMITNLLTTGKAIVGATGINIHTGEFLVFRAKSAILATGGAGQLYPFTTNPSDVTGDGYALAYRAGATLIDMEFIQWRACIVYPDALRGEPPPLDGLVTMGGRFYNTLGQRYMKKYYPKRIENVTREAIVFCAFKEIKAGRGTTHGGLYNDLSGVPEDELRRFNRFLGICRAVGINPAWQPVEWAPGVHHFMGGVRINTRCETDVPGLYAAGEVTGGIHGANRLGGNALTDAMVFGARAGKASAERAASIKTPKIDKKQVDVERKNRILTVLKRREGIHIQSVRKDIHEIMQNDVGVARKGSELRRAIALLERIESEEIPKLRICAEKGYWGIVAALETENLVEVGLMVARAALMRKESRGAHFRLDYPKMKDIRWSRSIRTRRRTGKTKLRARCA